MGLVGESDGDVLIGAGCYHATMTQVMTYHDDVDTKIGGDGL